MKQFILLALAGLIAAQADIEIDDSELPSQESKTESNMEGDEEASDMPDDRMMKADDKKNNSDEKDKETAVRQKNMGGSELIGQADFSRLFESGACPDVQGMPNIDYARLSGEWYLQRTDEPAAPELLPACHHAIFNVNADGSFSATEEIRVQGKVFVADEIEG
jgi:hypothetical protein